MYKLTLTSGQRQAFDWVGGRYAAGEMANILRDCMHEDDEWDSESTIDFMVPEHRAWEIRDLAEEEGYAWPCFDDELVEVMQTFLNQIV